MEGYVFTLSEESYFYLVIQRRYESHGISISKSLIDSIVKKKGKNNQSLASIGNINPNTCPRKKRSSSNIAKVRSLMLKENPPIQRNEPSDTLCSGRLQPKVIPGGNKILFALQFEKRANVEPLTYLELYSRRKAFVNISWRHPPAHPWYRSESPGATIHFKGDRKDQTALTRLISGHLKPPRFFRGDKKFNICTKCNMIEATPQHLLDCVVLVYDDLLQRQDFVLEVMKAKDLMDLI
ncbi:hypothetical protein AVEN_163949-1 [Araneus ventricosus]|uniref:Uncharacterized protein n=1 Tax=Araneus ventricosus TaxID=182803 RepID=A0A4Y2GZP5_ARAVE|nr:hypothetical protein AVEN_163949-1 [Araneus ventricosus]